MILYIKKTVFCYVPWSKKHCFWQNPMSVSSGVFTFEKTRNCLIGLNSKASKAIYIGIWYPSATLREFISKNAANHIYNKRSKINSDSPEDLTSAKRGILPNTVQWKNEK